VSLVDSLLGAIVRLDGDALVMHVGEKPYVVSTSHSLDAFRGPLAWGQVELATRRLTVEAVTGMVQQLLPQDEQHALTELGALQYEMPANPAVPGRFTVIAARGGDDIWLEIRYHRPPPPEVVFEPAVPAPAAEAPPIEAPALAQEPPAAPEPIEIPAREPIEVEVPAPIEVAAPVPIEIAAEAPVAEPAEEAPAIEMAGEEAAIEIELITEPEPALEPAVEAPEPQIELVAEPEPAPTFEPPAQAPSLPSIEIPAIAEAAAAAAAVPEEAEVYDLTSMLDQSGMSARVSVPVPVVAREPAATVEAAPLEVAEVEEAAESRLAVVLPLTRPIVRAETPSIEPAVRRSPLDRLLRIAAARGASALYIVTQAPPAVRVDGQMILLESEEPLSAADVGAMLMQLAPEPTREALLGGAETEWIADVPDVGRVRCLSFRDHRGPGGIFRMLPARALSVEQLGLSRAIQALCAEAEGLVLVTGPRASGKRTLVSAFVDLVNRTRADHVITLEHQIVFVHESRRSFVSQRELRGSSEALAAAAREALREGPDVLVIEDLRSPELAAVALEAAELGLLVFAGLSAPGATAAIERLIDQAPAERRAQLQASLAGVLRGVVAQVLVRKIGGGRLAAREVLLNTRAVAALIAEGRTFELAHAFEGGRRLGMTTLNDALVDAVRAGTVDPAEAYRRAHDREGLLTQLRREGIDTAFVERLA
jgi:twitching motility protein PilT